jgi:hypothetical protein
MKTGRIIKFFFSRRLDYSVLDNISTERCAPTFQLVTNKTPRGLHPILVGMLAFTQEYPDKHKKESALRKISGYISLLVCSPLHTNSLMGK